MNFSKDSVTLSDKPKECDKEKDNVYSSFTNGIYVCLILYYDDNDKLVE